MPKIAISIGDINGIGLEIALKSHNIISQICEPVYVTHLEIVESAAKILGLCVPKDMQCVADFELCNIDIKPGVVSKGSGLYSYKSFMQAIQMTESGVIQALVTLPIHKKAWQEAGVKSIGHTQVLSQYFGADSIMMLGCEEMFVALYTDHIPLSQVSQAISQDSVRAFLVCFARAVRLNEPCCVLGLNPHCGDDGLMGSEDKYITQAVCEANLALGKELFFGAYPPDSAFSPLNRKRFRYFVSMYHDVGLAPLKALYFEQSINVSLNLPILRTSVDHGVGFDVAYKREVEIHNLSYINAVKYAVDGL
ncbi:4-hydroxythreonine-4-phosphate dehydrogenase [Helicobacter labetoulli]|uniref:4-hydroxythreonine-4-phosphate dehydrogenase n=1 Tax=Helicobacter labetoulli TaxID=2315333 RepID=UPI000EF67056|nr:4-hydroxythreonine-4-phosphate dehydrogenase [Helicobacter labetoulli]